MKIRGWRLRAYCALPDLKLSRLNQPGRPGNTRPPPFGGSYHVASLEPPPASHAVTSGGVAESYRTTKSSQCDSLVPRRVRPRVRVGLARIMHHAAHFCTSAAEARAADPIGSARGHSLCN